MAPKTKVIAFDIYGTVLCTDDPENAMPPRTGFVEFILRVKSFGLKTISTSDADLTNLKLDLSATFRGRAPFGPEVFDDFYRLMMVPKDYADILADYHLNAEELLVIGNTFYKDLVGAPPFASRILVPSYGETPNNFDFSQIVIP